MIRLIEPRTDPWHQLAGEDGPLDHPSPTAHALLTLAQWHAARDGWPGALPVGLVLPNDADIESIAADLPRLALIALQFPKWVDGRAYSQARLLRVRLRYAGELRATGDVVADMMPLLYRTGFDSARLRAGQNAETALRALDAIGGHYQGDVVQPIPAFARDITNELAERLRRHRRSAELAAGEGI